MSKNSITIKNSVFVNSPPETVWDYTQDYNNRTQWDKAILEAEVLEEAPRVVKLRSKGDTTMCFIYKLDERPFKTSLAAREVQSAWMSGGGGAWTYENKDGARFGRKPTPYF